MNLPCVKFGVNWGLQKPKNNPILGWLGVHAGQSCTIKTQYSVLSLGQVWGELGTTKAQD